MPRKKIEMTKEEEKIYNEVLKLAKRANQRILSIERLTGTKDKFATKRLKKYLEMEKLNAWTKNSRVRVNKSMTVLQLMVIEERLNKFLNQEQTSTIRGIKEFKRKQIESIKNRYNKEGINISWEDAARFFEIFEMDDSFILDYMTASEFEAVNMEAIERKVKESTYVDMLEQVANVSFMDLDLMENVKILYEKYVKPFI